MKSRAPKKILAVLFQVFQENIAKHNMTDTILMAYAVESLYERSISIGII